MSYPMTPQAWLSADNAADLENTLVIGLDNGWSDGSAPFAPFDDLEAAGLVFVMHDGFLTVGYEGDSETIAAGDDRESEEIAADAIKAARELLAAC